MSGPGHVVFRIAYARASELRDDVTRQMTRGGLLVKIHEAADLTLDMPVRLELVLPDGTALHGDVRVLQVLTGFGVAVSVGADLIERCRRAALGIDAPGGGPARHERLARGTAPTRAAHATRPPPLPPPAPRTPLGTPAPAPAIPPVPAVSALDAPPPSPPAEPRIASRGDGPPAEPRAASRGDGPTRLEKVQLALHGNRDERNAILRDRDRTLHPFVLKNPQLDADDVLAIAKNAQMTADLLEQIGGRKDWVQRPAIALALARNPRTPPDIAVRALEHVSHDALRQIAKGTGVLPHVSQAARKKLLG